MDNVGFVITLQVARGRVRENFQKCRRVVIRRVKLPLPRIPCRGPRLTLVPPPSRSLLRKSLL